MAHTKYQMYRPRKNIRNYKGKYQIKYKIATRITLEFSLETLEVSRAWMDVL